MRRPFPTIFLRFFFALLFTIIAANLNAQSASGVWSSKFPTPPGANGTVYAMTAYGTNLIVAGEFSQIAGVHARGLAKFDGQTWSEFAGGIEMTNYSNVAAVVTDGTNLYAGGVFHRIGGVAAENIAKWTGDHWEALGDGLVGGGYLNPGASASAIYIDRTNIFVGGTFVRAGSVQAVQIARWDGSEWHALDQGVYFPTDSYPQGTLPPGRVTAITGDGTNVYVGGWFLKAGSINTTNLAMWDGSSWRSVGSTSEGVQSWQWDGVEISGFINSLTWYADKLYVVGDFKRVAGLSITNIAAWRDGTWDTPLIVDGPATAANVIDHDLYIAGKFDHVTDTSGSIDATNIVRIHNGEFSAVNTALPATQTLNMSQTIVTMQNYGGEFFVGGWFSKIDTISAGGIAKLTTSGWRSLSPGSGNSLDDGPSLATDGNKTYALLSGHYITQWDGTRWTPVPSPTTNIVWNIDLLGTALFAAAWDTNSNMILTRWDGNQWSQIDTQTTEPSTDRISSERFLVVGTNLFASFWGPVGVVTKWWNGSEWQQVPWQTSGLTSEALGSDGSTIYMLRRGWGIAVAKWDWTNIVTFPPPNITQEFAIGANGTNLWVSGAAISGNVAEGRFYKWDGSANWIAIPCDGYVETMAIANEKMIFGGWFTSIGGIKANSIAQWDGATWRSLDSGLLSHDSSAPIGVIKVIGKRVFVGGFFDQAGPQSSGNIAIWYQADDLHLALQPNALNVIYSTGGIGDHVQIETSDNLQSWTPLIDYTRISTNISTYDPRSISSTNRFFRAKFLEP